MDFDDIKENAFGIIVLAVILLIFGGFVWLCIEDEAPPKVGSSYYYTKDDRDPFAYWTDDTVKILDTKNDWVQFQCKDMTVRNETKKRFKEFMSKCGKQP